MFGVPHFENFCLVLKMVTLQILLLGLSPRKQLVFDSSPLTARDGTRSGDAGHFIGPVCPLEVLKTRRKTSGVSKIASKP